jgi:SAM-dependent methyltransferase
MVECNLCGWKGIKFCTIATPTGERKNAACPSCGSLERHRGLIHYLNKRGDIWNLAVLDVAPGFRIFKDYFKRRRCRYVSVNLSMSNKPLADKPEVIGDVRQLPFSNESFDLVFCYHVLEHLEHIRNGMLAMREIYRVLRSNWMALIQIPFDKEKDTVEYKSPDSSGHYVCYGKDIGDKIRSIGFNLYQVDFSDIFDKAEVIYFGFEKGCGITFLCEK